VSVPANSVIHDEATVTGAGPTPTGTIDFDFFTEGTCDGTPTTEAGVALSGGVAESTATAPLLPGSYSYLAHYGGDANYAPDDGVCEPFSVDLFASTVTTQVHDVAHTDVTNGSVPANSVIHDEATVTGSGPTPTGTIDFDFFTDGTCSGTPTTESGVTLTGGVAESSATAALSAGSYSYLAHYSGDANYGPDDGVCEPFSVTEIDVEIITVRLDVDKQVMGSAVPANGTSFVVNVSCTGSTSVSQNLQFTYPSGHGVQSISRQIPSDGSLTCTVTETGTGRVILQGYRIDGGAIQSNAPTITLNLGRSQVSVIVVNDPGTVVVGGIPRRLAFTGFTVGTLLKLGLALLVIGGGLWLAARHRRRSSIAA
jgi:hypothetical protein